MIYACSTIIYLLCEKKLGSMAVVGKKQINILPAQTSDMLDYSLIARVICGMREDCSATGEIPVHYYFHETIEHMM